MNKAEEHDESIFVFTHKTKDFLTSINGSTSWKLDPSRAAKCKYIICVKNRNHRQVLDDDKLIPIEERIEHRSAFLIGRVSKIVPSSTNEARNEKRYTVQFDKYAEIDKPNNAWETLCDRQRWPVKYLKTADLPEMFMDKLGVDFDTLDFQDIKEEDWNFANIYLEQENEYLPKNKKNKIAEKNAAGVVEFIGGPETPDAAMEMLKNRKSYEMSDSDDPTNDLSIKGISIKEAKTRLSFAYDIPEENIEIILKG